MSTPKTSTGSVGSWNSIDGVPDGFPVGLRVLVVDDDSTCLSILGRMLQNCLYAVTKCNHAEKALQMLRNRKDGFDIVISDVHMPNMDGFKLLEHIGLEMDLPVVMMSADDTQNVVTKMVNQGACDYLIKPVRMESLRNIWQHVVRKKKNEWKGKDSEEPEDGEWLRRSLEEVDSPSSANEGNCKFYKRRKHGEGEIEGRDDTSTLKKPRVVWSSELHRQFVTAVDKLGVDKAVPKKILEIMNVPGLTRENIASHLQKYRLYLKRASSSLNAAGPSYMSTPDATFSAISSFSGLNLQAFAISNQFPRHCATPVQTPSLGRFAPGPASSVTPVDQRRFRFKNPNMGFMEGPHPPNNNVRQTNLLHGVPTNMDSRQLATLHQAAQIPHGNMNQPIRLPSNQNNMLQSQMVQPQPSSQISIQTNGTHIMNQTSASQPQTRSDFCRPVYSVSQPLKAVDFSSSPRTKLPGDSFSLVSSSVLVNSEVKGHGMDNQQQCDNKLLSTKAEKMGQINLLPDYNKQLYYQGMDDELNIEDFDLMSAFHV